jgi:hypothetical protein
MTQLEIHIQALEETRADVERVITQAHKAAIHNN